MDGCDGCKFWEACKGLFAIIESHLAIENPEDISDILVFGCTKYQLDDDITVLDLDELQEECNKERDQAVKDAVADAGSKTGHVLEFSGDMAWVWDIVDGMKTLKVFESCGRKFVTYNNNLYDLRELKMRGESRDVALGRARRAIIGMLEGKIHKHIFSNKILKESLGKVNSAIKGD